MPLVPRPDDDVDRVASLRALGLLDSEPEERFDRVTRVAAALFDVPMALIGLVDQDRQWCKSSIGLRDREIPRRQSFCAYAILRDDLLVVPDTRADERFADNPLVTGDSAVRFYAGRPLRSPDGSRVGTLGILDRRPRQLGPTERGHLDDLGAWAQSELGDLALTDAVNALADEDLARAITASVHDGIVTVGADGRIRSVNPAIVRMFGRHDLIGAGAEELVVPNERPIVIQLLDDRLAKESGSEVRVELHGRGKHGAEVPIEVVVTDLVVGGELSFAVVARDVTARREVERVTNDLVSVVSHELRTPLTSLLGSLGLLASGALGQLSERGSRMVDIALANADRLHRLVNDILDLDRIAAGAASLDLRPCCAAEVMAQALEAVRGVAERADVTLCAAFPPFDLLADPDRLVQVAVNLIGNAVKFSPAGATVTVLTSVEKGAVHLAVSDEGPGIPADGLSRIFERFEQVGSSDTRAKGGTGLGLTIARDIVKQHGGRIWAESVEGEGSTFHVALPAGVTRSMPTGCLPSGRVMIVEDDRRIAGLLADAMWQLGVAVCWSSREDDAIGQIGDLEFDVVVLGVGGDGNMETADRIRNVDAGVPVILSVKNIEDGGRVHDARPEFSVTTIDAAGLAELIDQVRRLLPDRGEG